MAVSLCAFAAPTLAAPSDNPPLGSYVNDLGGTPYFGPGLGLTSFGPEEGDPLGGARLDVTFDFDGATLGSELLVSFDLPVDGTTVNWTLTGADLGFPAANGTFSASVETSAFSGVVTNDSPFPFVPFEIFVGSTDGELFGTAIEMRFEADIVPSLAGDVASISTATGGSQVLDLVVGPSEGPGRPYLVLGSVSGTTPETVFGGVDIPLVVDGYTLYTLGAPGVDPLTGSIGFFGAEGTAQATFTLPTGHPNLAGLVVWHAALVFDPLFQLTTATDPVGVLLLP